MAQAARQNLRMQKELKLLLTDPPPGVSLSASSSSSLTSIDAEIKGPEGTVYANGVFHIKIQIPDRYPFQPPNVTFATPIYHPNIDTGGRICLDILNLPPKGAWQPSLNISTVLMSIGLLLSEPNPDDGLMCEASSEYKYNRQTFDQKARSMTEKYAKSGVTGGSIGSGSTPSKPSPLMAEVEERSLELKTFNGEHVDHKRLGRVSRKLSLEFSATSQKKNNDDENNIADADNSSFLLPQTLALNASASFPRQDVGIHNEQPPHHDDTSKTGSESIDLCPGKLSGRPHKLSLRSSLLHQIMPNHDKENASQNQSFHTNTKINSVTSNSPFQPEISEHVDQQLDRDHEIGSENQKKVTGIGRKLSLHSSCSTQRKSEKDSVTDTNSRVLVSKSEHIPVSTKSSILQLNEYDDRKQPHKVYNEQRNKGTLSVTRRKLGIAKKLPVETAATFKWEDDGNKENVPPNYQLISENTSMTSPSLVMPQASNSNAESPQQGHDHGVQYGRSVGQKKSFDSGKKVLMLSSGATRTRLVDQKVEQLSPHYQNSDDIPLSSKSLQLRHAVVHDDEAHWGSGGKGLVNCSSKKNEEEITDAVIVLDSEDSEEEVKVSARSRLSIARKPLAGKRKAKV